MILLTKILRLLITMLLSTATTGVLSFVIQMVPLFRMGPSGAGVSICLQDPDEVLDAGVSIGLSSNNAAELVALLICFVELLRLADLRHFCTAFIFCDSSYAIHQATSSKLPIITGF